MKIKIPRGEEFNFYSTNSGLVFPGFVNSDSFDMFSSKRIRVIEYGNNDWGVIRCTKLGDRVYEIPGDKEELFPTKNRYKSVYRNVFGVFGKGTFRDENNSLVAYVDFINPDGDPIRGISLKNGKAFKDSADKNLTTPFNVISSLYCLVSSNGEYYDNLLFRYPDGVVQKAFDDDIKVDNLGNSTSYVIEKDGKYNIIWWNGSHPVDVKEGVGFAKFVLGFDSFTTVKPVAINTRNNVFCSVLLNSGMFNLYDLKNGRFVFDRGVEKIYTSKSDDGFYAYLAKEYGMIPVCVKYHREYEYCTMINMDLVEKWIEKNTNTNDILDLARWRTSLEDGRTYEKLFFTEIEKEIVNYKGEPCVKIRCGYNLYNGDSYGWKYFGLKTKTLKN